MQREITTKTEKYILENRKYRIWVRIVAALILLVLFGTTCMLIRPVFTMESGVYCQKEEHTHTKDCYAQIDEKISGGGTSQLNERQLICGQDEQHVHTDDCYTEEQNLICEAADEAAHTHTDACWNKTVKQVHTHTEECYVLKKGALCCSETEGEGHTHGSGCYTPQKGSLLCTQQEGNGHSHTDACYTESVSLICGQNESAGHTHSQSCYDEGGNVICGQQESTGHTHSDACRQVTRTLSCGQAECAAHWHSDSCYEWNQVLTCTQSESAAHHHTDSCYEWNKTLACEQEETEIETELVCSQVDENGHVHTEECYETVKTLTCTQSESHIHSDECYAETEEDRAPLNCTKNHQHTEMCYGTWELVCEKEEHEHELICYSDKTADLESASIWEKTMSGVALTGDWTEDIIAIAESQLGYAESIQNYIVNEDGKKKGYSRYGAWYGDPYGDWCAMFVSFCLNYAEITRSDFPYEANCHRWVQSLNSRGMYVNAADWDPKKGDIIFFDNDGDGVSEHVGIVAELIAYGDDPAAQIRTIEGNTSSGHVAYKLYSRNASGIMGYGILPETLSYEEEAQVDELIEKINTLPTALEADAVQKAYIEAEDEEGYSTYLRETAKNAAEAKQIYDSLTELQKKAVVNDEDLEDLLQLLQKLGWYEGMSETEIETETNTEGESEIETETDTEVETETETETDTEVETETETETDTEVETETETETETEIETESATDGSPEDIGAFVQVSCYDSEDKLTEEYVDGSEFKLSIQFAAAAVASAVSDETEDTAIDPESVSTDLEAALTDPENGSTDPEAAEATDDPAPAETYTITLDEHFTNLAVSEDQPYTIDAAANTLTFSAQSANDMTQFTVTGNVSYGEDETEMSSETAPVIGNETTVMLLAETGDNNVLTCTTDDGLTVTATITGVSVPAGTSMVFTRIGEDDSEYEAVIDGEDLAEPLVQEHRMYRISFVDSEKKEIYFDESFTMQLSLKWTNQWNNQDKGKMRAYLYNCGNDNHYSIKEQTIGNAGNQSYTVTLTDVAVKKDEESIKYPVIDVLLNFDKVSFAYNEVRDALINDPAYVKYYNVNSPIGTAGSFHIVAFDTATLRVHTNGNVLAKNLIAGSNFGTNNLNDELSYVQNYKTVHPTSASKDNHYLVVGSENKIGLEDNYSALAVNGTKIDKPKHLIQDKDTAKAPFVDLTRVENEIKSISANLANYPSSSETIMTAVTTGNSIGLTLNNPDYVGVFCTTATDISEIDNNADFSMKGFSAGHSGAIVLNIDCSGWSGKTLTLPHSTVYVDGQEQSKTETLDFSAGKVVWNFINAEGVTINAQRMTGMIIAPESNIILALSFNGTAVGNNVENKTETHRTDFTGKIVPTEDTDEMGAHIHVYKVDKDNYGTLLSGAEFALYEWNSEKQEYVLAEQNSDDQINITDANGSVLFKQLKYNVAYKLVETKAPYGYQLSEDALYFYFDNKDTNKYPESKPANFTASEGTASGDCLIHYYPNTAKEKEEDKTEISVEKKWYSANGAVSNPSTLSVQVQLYQIFTPIDLTANKSEKPYRSPVILSQGSGWKYTFSDLPIQEYDQSGNVIGIYSYYVQELDAQQYSPKYLDKEVKEVNQNTPITSGTITIENYISNDTYLLPETGGCGTEVYTVSGLLLLMAGCFLMYKKREKRM